VTVQLLIRDGSPWWYLSPDIWVVPGTDPNGTPGSPVAGTPAYIWARIQNTGDSDAANVRLDYYWADPTMQVTRSNAHFVGSAFATVPAGATREALCLVAWMPTIVNDGHECLVVTATHASDPLPSPLPDAFDPPTYRQVAQKNLTVLQMAMKMIRSVPLTLSGLARADKQVLVDVEVGGKLDREMLTALGLHEHRRARGGRVEVGLSTDRGCVGEDEPLGEHRLELTAHRGTSAGCSVRVRSHGLRAGEYELVNGVERSGDRVLGGLAFVVVGGEEEGDR
jgi:hypothetical protein